MIWQIKKPNFMESSTMSDNAKVENLEEWQRNDSKKDMCNQCKAGVIHDKGSDCEQTLQEKIEDLLDSYVETYNTETEYVDVIPVKKTEFIAEALVRMFEKELQNQKKAIVEKINEIIPDNSYSIELKNIKRDIINNI